MQRRPAHDLHVEEALAQRPSAGLAHGRECLRQQLVKRLPLRQAGPELVGLLAQLGVGHRGEVVLQGTDHTGYALQPPQGAALTGTQHLLEQLGHQVS